MLNGGANLRDEPVTGIDGYRVLTNRSYQPYFELSVPSNWFMEEHRLETKQGEWISLNGPANASKSRVTALDIYVFEDDDTTQSVREIVEKSIIDEGIGEYQIVSRQDTNISGVQGQEVRITYTSTYRTTAGLVEVDVVKQWITTMHGDYVVQLFYEAPKEDFDTYFSAYEMARQTLKFIN